MFFVPQWLSEKVRICRVCLFVGIHSSFNDEYLVTMTNFSCNDECIEFISKFSSRVTIA